ncbi:MAG: DUF3794 domain-containing protein [Niameybacter sp.]|uniref:DUF3794 domain-containing protein n=1 Tax=Niameybacter sp. TaxID=2033640 RepID=UPI002FC6A8C2
MATHMRELIEYHGVNRCAYGKLPYFKQINRDFTFCVSMQKPDIEQIVKVWVKPDIVQQKIVVTPIGTSLEGQRVTGYKVMVMGDIMYKVEYVVLEASQSLHTAHVTIPFCGDIVLPEEFNTNSIVITSVSVEDIYSEPMDTRCIYNNITMMLIADLC